jgi:CRP/FNR family transcriptional regulator
VGQDVTGLLARVPVFETLAPDDLARVAEVAVPRRFTAGQVIFREGDESDTCYVVPPRPRRGAARPRRRPDDRPGALRAGRHLRRAGDVRRRERSATVEALDDLHALAILGNDMRRLLREHPDIASSSSSRSGRRLRRANERLARQSFQTVQSRVAGVLIGMVEQQRREGGPDEHVLLTTTQAEVAQLAGSSRESASRFLAVLERAGIVAQGRGKLTVHDPSALQRYVY